jgi:hypothetical protein
MSSLLRALRLALLRRAGPAGAAHLERLQQQTAAAAKPNKASTMQRIIQKTLPAAMFTPDVSQLTSAQLESRIRHLRAEAAADAAQPDDEADAGDAQAAAAAGERSAGEHEAIASFQSRLDELLRASSSSADAHARLVAESVGRVEAAPQFGLMDEQGDPLRLDLSRSESSGGAGLAASSAASSAGASGSSDADVSMGVAAVESVAAAAASAQHHGAHSPSSGARSAGSTDAAGGSRNSGAGASTSRPLT